MAGNQRGFLTQWESCTGSANLESLNPFSNIDPLISEVTHESNINVAEINEDERETSVRTLRLIFMKTKATVMKIFAPEDDHRNVFDIFEDIEH